MADLRWWGEIRVPDGSVAVVAGADALQRIFFLGPDVSATQTLQRTFPRAEAALTPLVTTALTQVEGYFSGRLTDFELPLDLKQKSPFEQRVLENLARIPYGRVTTYGELAAQSGSPRAGRAVGRIMAGNPFPLVLPCHRVVRADGRVGEYSGGCGSLSKQRLLDFERRCLSGTVDIL